MQECQSVQRLLDAFIDNEVCSSEAALVQQHIEDCSECASLLEDLLALKKTLRELPQDKPSPALKARVLERLDKEAKGRIPAWLGFRPWPLAVGAAAALIVLAVIWQGGFVKFSEPMYPLMLADHHHVLSSKAETDMMSEDPEALWKWMNERSPFPIPSSLVSRSKLSLVGGRVAKMKGEDMVSIHYMHAEKQVSLHAMKSQAPMPSSAKKMMVKGMPLFVDRYEGYNVVMWKEGGLLVCAVSDLQKDSLIDMIVEAHPGKPLEV
jgi:anti-sigma factor RsiW